MSFTHLHVHTEYSLLDGVSKIPNLFTKVKESGMDSVALTDHGVLYGAGEFWKYSHDFGVKPIIGCEVYLAPKERGLRETVNGIKYYHLLLLAKNVKGYRNLVKLVTIGQLEGLYYKPRIDRETLAKYSEGLICTSACMAGPLSRHILRKEYDKAEEWLQFLKNTFKDDFYIELQRHGFDGNDNTTITESGLEIQETMEGEDTSEESIDNVNQQKFSNLRLREFADKYKLPLVATTDAHYLNKEDKEVQTVLFAIKDGKLLNDETGRKGYEGTYILSPEEMQTKFADEKSALDNTMVISDKIEEYNIGFDRVQPKYWNIEKESNAEKELIRQTYAGAITKYEKSKFREPKNNTDTGSSILDSQDSRIKNQDTNIKQLVDEVNRGEFKNTYLYLGDFLTERIQYELKVIHDKGYDDYFLVVSDLMKWAASQGILMGVRGSVAGSVVAHCLDIVEVEPIKWELYFERFLNPERPSPPDIDMDIQDSRRDEVIKYVKDKYGEDAVAAIITFGKLNTKAAIRDVSRVMNIDLKIADRLSKMVNVVFGKSWSIDKMIETNNEFASIINSSSELKKMAEIVRKIDKMRRHVSVHACGHLITPGPISDYVPEQLESKGDKRVIVQYEFPWLEELGLMKFDFLGLRTLTILQTAIELINRNHIDAEASKLDFYNIPDGDKKTFDLFTRGDTIGVFQFESPPMQQYLRDLRPETQEDICFLAAAYRPGPMGYIPDYILRKHGQQEVKYLVPEMEAIVGKTFGFAIYQEQVIKIAVDVAGYSMGGADVLRRAMGKKKVEVMQKEEIKFKDGIKQKGYSEAVGTELWKYLLPFADYGFNKAHAAGYAVLAYKCAYLKAHYPLEFITALIHSDLQDLDRVAIDISEAKRMGYKVLSPNINYSEVEFYPDSDKSIRFGLGAIKNVGAKACEEIIKNRKENGEYLSLDDFISRIGTGILNKRVLEALIFSGALDDFGDRNALHKALPEVINKINKKDSKKHINQQDLFAADPEALKLSKGITKLPEVALASDSEKMAWEKEYLGLFISTHPLNNFGWVYIWPEFTKITDIENIKPGKEVKLLSIITKTKTTFTKKDNQKMAILTLEDLFGKIDSVVFPKSYEKFKHLLLESSPLIIKGVITEREDKKSFMINSIEHGKTLTYPKKIELNIVGVNNSDVINSIKDVVFPTGEQELIIQYGKKGSIKTVVRKTDLNQVEIVNKIRFLKSSI